MNKIVIKTIIVLIASFLIDTDGIRLMAKKNDSLERKDATYAQGRVNALENKFVSGGVDTQARKSIQDIQIDLEKSKSLSQSINLLISWIGAIFAIISVMLIIAGFYTIIKLKKINKREKKLKRVQLEYETRFSDFEKEKNILMKLIFPVIKGENSYLQGDYFNVFYHYDEAKKIAPKHPWLKTFVWPLINSGRFDEAIRYLNSQLEFDPNNSDWKYYLAHVYRRQGRLEDSEKLIEPVATEEKHPLALYEYATILFIREDFHKAEKMYKEANDRHLLPDLYTYLNLAITQTINDKLKDAKVSAHEAVRLIKEEQAKTKTNPHLFLQLGVAELILEETGAVRNIKKSTEKKKLQSENAKSALDKIKKMGISFQTPDMLESIKILEKYCNDLIS